MNLKKLTFKQRMFAWYITNRNYLTKGIGEINSFKEILMFYLVISLWVKNNGIYVPESTLIIGSVFALIGFWWFGSLWDRLRLYHIEAEFGNARNDFVLEARKKFKKIK